ncbi:MAG: isopentenyl-diphosphate Delta-isomerase [Bacteroidota bacterium]|nr:isopentenyl-diphosphate Delta-isomerase [Bacteroidota bacterium]
MEQVILVNESDEEIGAMEKLQAHREAKLHRAISVFVFNNKGQFLLQKRAKEKYHSANLWSNTCCSHPRPGEQTHVAAKRRLTEEMGIECDLQYKFSFIYKAELESGLTEYELDHVFLGVYNGEPDINRDEVSDWKYENLESIEQDLLHSPESYTAWFKIVFERVLELRK